MSDIEKFLIDNPEFASSTILSIKETLSSYPNQAENINFALECIKSIVDSEQEKYIAPVSSTTVAQYING